MHIRRRAPLLSAASNIDCIWIIVHLQNLIKSFCHRLEADSERAASLLQLALKCSPYSATARSTISTKHQTKNLAKGRHWAMVTRSPCLHSLNTTKTKIFVERRTYLPYIGCGTLR